MVRPWGILKAYHAPTDRHYYTYGQYLQFKGITPEKDNCQKFYEELLQAIISILRIFSCRLYRLRKYKKQIVGDEEIAKELQDGNKSHT